MFCHKQQNPSYFPRCVSFACKISRLLNAIENKTYKYSCDTSHSREKLHFSSFWASTHFHFERGREGGGRRRKRKKEKVPFIVTNCNLVGLLVNKWFQSKTLCLLLKNVQNDNAKNKSNKNVILRESIIKLKIMTQSNNRRGRGSQSFIMH